MKSEFQKVVEEVRTATQMEIDAENTSKKQEEDCRKQYDIAKQEMEAALVAGNKKLYIEAGMKVEKLRLETEFFEKINKAGRKPASNTEVNGRICKTLRAEARDIGKSTLSEIKKRFLETMSVCNEAIDHLNEIDRIYSSWKVVVMKENPSSKPSGNDIIALYSFSNLLAAEIKRLTFIEESSRK